MRKILPIFIALVVFVGVAYALVPAFFPDTAFFPRVPSGSGSIGGVISKVIGDDIETYIGTGVIENTLMLDGTTATGYLRGNTCLGTDKWIGIDASNRPVCGTTSTLIGDFGTIESQDCSTSTIYHASGSSTNPTSTGHTLKSGDILKTPPGCTMTIVFSDLSILRLDGDTVVSFDIGYLSGGTTIASALLENGSLWGRILTETGSYNVGTNEIIAGVRGTSISLVSTGNTIGTIAWSGTGWNIPRTPSPYGTEVTVIDTLSTTGAVISCRKSNGTYRSISNLAKTNSYIIAPGDCNGPAPTVIIKPKHILLTSSNWVKKNTKKDIDYMYRKISLSGATMPVSKQTLIKNEITTTIPESNVGILTATGILEANSLCSAGEVYWNERYGCQSDRLLAIADYSLPVLSPAPLFPTLDIRTITGAIISRQNDDYGSFTMSAGGGINLSVSPKLSYNNTQILSSLSGGDLRGKTIEIELIEPIATTSLQYFLDFGNGNYLKYNHPILQYYYKHAGSDRTLPYGAGSNIADGVLFSRDSTMKMYTYKISAIAIISSFVIGSDSSGNNKIGKKIKSIKILN